MNPSPELVKQIAEEYKQILNAPPIAYGPSIPTCHFCGRVILGEPISAHDTLTHPGTGQTIVVRERWKGDCCGTASGKPEQVRPVER